MILLALLAMYFFGVTVGMFAMYLTYDFFSELIADIRTKRQAS